jgi:hypothetical protein
VEVGFRRRTNEGKEHEKKESGRRKERESEREEKDAAS